MFECRACLQRCIRAIAGDAQGSYALSRTKPLLTPHFPSSRYASTAVATKKTANDGLVPGRQPIEVDSHKTISAKGSMKNVKNDQTIRNKRHLEMELEYLGDRVKLAEHVHYTLRNNDPEKALNLCRLASKHQEAIVAWNHCIDWHMHRGKVDDAIKIYNEMKKRAQFPDGYTYVLLLRGLAKKPPRSEQPVKESNVTKAMSIYNSMFAPNSRVKPTIFHTNSVLRVCAAALDLDAMWGVAAKLPEKGPGKADHITYTILIDAIRYGAFAGRDEMLDENVTASPEQLTKRRDQAVQEGRRLWQEVISKWREGEVQVDEELVCAMGRLLLISRRIGDWDDILNLVRQTMNIDRLLAPLGDPERKVEHIPTAMDPEAGIHAEQEPEEDSEGYTDAPSALAFKVVQLLPPDPAHPYRPKSLEWVKPGNPTLSLLIDACTILRSPKTASAYWDLLTEEHSVKPDLANFNAQLKLLRINRGSTRAAKILSEDMVAAGVEPKYQTFRIAMAICMRDKNNHKVMSNARTVIDVMEKLSPDLDVHTLSEFLVLALKTDDGEQIVSALNRLDPIIHNLRSRITYGTEEQGKMSPQQHLADKKEIQGFFSTVVGVIDTLMNRGLVPREDFQQWHAKRSMLTQVIGRAKASNEKLQQRLETSGEELVSAKGKGLPSYKVKINNRDMALRNMRYKGKVERENEQSRFAYSSERQDGVLTGFRVRDLERTRQQGVREWSHQWKLRKDGFADSPMELSDRG